MNHISGIAAISLSLLFVSTLGVNGAQCQSSDWRNELLSDVSSLMIVDVVEDLQSFGTRDFHTQSAAESADYIREQFQEMGLQTYLQEFHVDDAEVVNVVAVLNPEASSQGVYVVGAHYDSENSGVTNQSEAENTTAPGADDNASGVSVMLEVARVLSHSGVETTTVKFVAFGAEEMGFDYSGGTKGSIEFVAQENESGANIAGAFVLDMVGYRATQENRITIVCNEGSENLSETVEEATSVFDLDIAVVREVNDQIIYSDHSAFWAQGFRSVLIIEELDPATKRPVNPFYHSSEDTVDKLSDEQMAVVAEALLGALLDLTCQGEDSYTHRSYVFAAAVAIAVAIGVALFLLSRRKGGYSDVRRDE